MNDSVSNLSTQGNSNAPASLASGTMPLRQKMSRALPKMYQRVYLTVIGTLIATVAVTALILHFVILDGRRAMAYRTFAELVAESLPSNDASSDELTRVINHWIARTGAKIAVFDGDGRLIAGGDDEVAQNPVVSQWQEGFVDNDGSNGYLKRLVDGRWVSVRVLSDAPARRWTIVAALIAVALGVAVAVYPVIRRITSRLEGLQQSVEALGEGKLGARVQVSGTDEVAVLAESFNRAAARVEALVAAQKRLLAFASHELRSPLARIQMALSLVGTHKDEEARGEINTSIRELDKLIGEILLSSRFDSENFQAVMSRQPIDLTGLAAEEGARAGVEIQGEHLHVLGDITLLRRLIRNLIENAQRYAGGTLIMVRVERYESNKALIAVSDQGPGVPADQRELVFEPFYRILGSSEKDGGVGLGLALVRSIASQHSGRAYYVDREGGGACFCVALPLAAAT